MTQSNNTPQQEEWEKEYEREFGNLTLGILSGDKGSPVFVNNELEVPRLKNFIQSLLQQAHAAGIKSTDEEWLMAFERSDDTTVVDGEEIIGVRVKNNALAKTLLTQARSAPREEEKINSVEKES